MFEMHGEKSDNQTGLITRSILLEGGLYHLQWREVDPSVEIGPDEARAAVAYVTCNACNVCNVLAYHPRPPSPPRRRAGLTDPLHT